MFKNDVVETEDLNEKAEKLGKPEHAAVVKKQYEDITQTKKKDIICIAYQQGKVFEKIQG